MSRCSRATLFAVAAIAGCVPPAVPHVEAVDTWRLDDLTVTGAPNWRRDIASALESYADVRQRRLLSVDAHGLLYLDGGDVYQLANAPEDAPVVRLTSRGDVAWARLDAHGDLVFAADHGGDEQLHLYRQRGSSLESMFVARIAHPIASHGALAWAEPAPDGTRTTLWVERDDRQRAVLSAEGSWVPVDIAEDGRVLARRTWSSTRSAIYLVADGAARPIAETDAAMPDARFAGNAIYAISDAGRDFLGLWELPAHRLVADVRGDVTHLAVAPDASEVAFAADEDGASKLRVVSTATGAIEPLDAEGGTIDELAYGDRRGVLALSFSSPTEPRTVLQYDRDARKIALMKPRLRVSVVAPERTTIWAGDVALPAFVYRSRESRRVPVVIELHGGPEDHWRAKWSAFDQFLVSRGFCLVQVDVRGSTGRGKAFAALDDGARRTAVLGDLRAVRAWIRKQPELDGERVAVFGTSYGGWLALAAAADQPDLRAAIAMTPITDLAGFLAGTSPERRDERRAEYGDERDPATREFLATLVPRVTAIRAPVLIAQGQRDPRVPPATTDRFVAELRRAGGHVWYLVADDEGHGFTRPVDRGVFEVLATQLLETALR